MIADGQGTAWALGVRDCSVQRRNQKVIEESASPVLSPEQAAELKASAERLAARGRLPRRGAPSSSSTTPARGCSRSSRSTPACRSSTRSPRPPPASTWSRRSCTWPPAAGSEGAPPAERGHAIEARLNAEDPDRDFAPSPGPDRAAGPARRAGHPGGHRRQRGRHHPGRLRLDDREDHRVRPRPRRGARPAAPRDGRDHGDHRGRRDQQELRARPARPARGDRRQRGHRLDRPGPRARAGSSRTGTPRVALAAAAIEAYEEEERVERQRLLSTAHGGRPQVQHESGRPLDLKLRGAGYRVRVARVGAHRFRVGIEAGGDVRTADVELERFDRAHRPDRRQRHPVPAGHRHARADPPGRGGRRHAPGQPRRGRRPALARARAGRRHAAGRSAPRSRRARRCSCWRA